MNHFSQRSLLRLLLLLIWGVFVVIVTTQSNRVPLVGLVIGIFGNSDFTATVGHSGLFATLTGGLYGVLTQRLPSTFALRLAMIVMLMLGTITEFAQIGVMGRDAATADLLANWLGVFIVGFLVASFPQKFKSEQHP